MKTRNASQESLGKWKASSQWQKQELKGKFFPFSSFLNFFVYEEGDDNNVVTFFSLFEQKNMMTMCRCFLLYVFSYEEGNNNPSSSLLFI